MAEEVRADHIKVKWKKPKDNGGEELKGYIIEKMDLDTGRWVSAGEVQTILNVPTALLIHFPRKQLVFFNILILIHG